MNVTRMGRWNAGSFLHLHLLYQVLSFTAKLICFFCVFVEEKRCKCKDKHCDNGKCKRPRDNIELWVHKPVTTICINSKQQNSKEYE